MEKIITKWYTEDSFSDTIKVKVVTEYEDGTCLCQPIYKDPKGNEIAKGKIIVNKTQLSETPLELVKFEEEKKEIERKREQLKKDLDQERQKIKDQCGRLDGRVKWLKRVEKEAHPEAIKQMIHFMYCLIEAKDLYLFQPCWGGFEVCKFNILEEQNPFFRNERDTSKFRLLSLYPGNEYPLNKEIEWCLAEYSDGSGDHRPIKIFDDFTKLQEYATQYVNAKEGLTSDLIKTCAEIGVQIPQDKLRIYYEEKLDFSKKQIKDHSDSIAYYEKSKAELIEKINQLTNQEEQK